MTDKEGMALPIGTYLRRTSTVNGNIKIGKLAEYSGYTGKRSLRDIHNNIIAVIGVWELYELISEEEVMLYMLEN
jgi:hypothetical protein